MSISKDNKRIIITMPKDLAEQLKNLATKDKRSISNYINILVEKELSNSNTRA